MKQPLSAATLIVLGMAALVGGTSCPSQSEPSAGRGDKPVEGATDTDASGVGTETIRFESQFFEYVSGMGAAGIFVEDGRAYVTTLSGLLVYDVSEPARPKRLGLYPLELPAFVIVADNYAYVARGTMQGENGNLSIVDVSDPRSMRLVGNIRLPWGAISVAIRGKYAYLGGYDAGLFVVDIEDKKAPQLVGTVKFPRIANPLAEKFPYNIIHALASKEAREHFPHKMGRTWWLHVKDDLLYVCDENTGLHVMDLSDPASPKEVGRFLDDGTWPEAPGLQGGAANDVDVVGHVACVAADNGGMQVLDVSRTDRPRMIAHYDPWAEYKWETSPGHMVQVVVKDAVAFLTAGEAGFHAVDVTSPSRPRLAAKHSIRKDVGSSWGIFIDGGYAYITYLSVDPGTSRPGLKGGWEIVKIVRQSMHEGTHPSEPRQAREP